MAKNGDILITKSLIKTKICLFLFLFQRIKIFYVESAQHQLSAQTQKVKRLYKITVYVTKITGINKT